MAPVSLSGPSNRSHCPDSREDCSFLLEQIALDTTICVVFIQRWGGQGLVHLASRTATFSLQFIQKYLTGPEDLVWRDVASCILRRVNNLGLDAALFLTDFKFLKLGGLPPLLSGCFKSWGLKCKRSEKCNSLHWLLKEPLMCGAKMGVCCSTVPGLMGVLCS